MQFCTKKKIISVLGIAAAIATGGVVAYYFRLIASNDDAQVGSPPSVPNSPLHRNCPWLKSNTGSIDVIGCSDGTMCNASLSSWLCCGVYERTLCPLNLPRMCENTTCGNGHHCCEEDCSEYGGDRHCYTPSPPPLFPPGVPSECPQRPPPPPRSPPPQPPPPSFPPNLPSTSPQRPPPPPSQPPPEPQIHDMSGSDLSGDIGSGSGVASGETT